MINEDLNNTLLMNKYHNEDNTDNNNEHINEDINEDVNEDVIEHNNEHNNEKKKRGRKPKMVIKEKIIDKIPKKRGRKPTGKIIELNKNYEDDISFNDCMIAHLKLDIKQINKIISDDVKYDIIDNFNTTNVETEHNLTKIVFDDIIDISKGIRNKHSNYINEINSKRKIIKSKIEFLDKENNKWKESSDIACWWCCHKFNTTPLGLPNYFTKEKFYVYGCFCSLNCAYAYNLELNDYKIWDRQTLLYYLKSIIFTDNEFILKPAPPRQVLKLFGGYMDIEIYRENFFIVSKEYMYYLPPLISIIGTIEENNLKNDISNMLSNNDENNFFVKKNKNNNITKNN